MVSSLLIYGPFWQKKLRKLCQQLWCISDTVRDVLIYGQRIQKPLDGFQTTAMSIQSHSQLECLLLTPQRLSFHPIPKEKLAAVTSTSILLQPPFQAQHTRVEEALPDEQRALQPPGTGSDPAHPLTACHPAEGKSQLTPSPAAPSSEVPWSSPPARRHHVQGGVTNAAVLEAVSCTEAPVSPG